MKHSVSVIVVLAVVLLALAPAASADVPGMMTYQGRLTDEGGTPLDTIVDMYFAIYDDSTGGATLWSETHLMVNVSGGLFTVNLGEGGTEIDDSVFRDTGRWLGITVGTDSEISPRTRLATMPYAFRVSTVDGATGGTISGDVAIQSDLDLDGDLRVTGAASIGTATPSGLLKLEVYGKLAPWWEGTGARGSKQPSASYRFGNGTENTGFSSPVGNMISVITNGADRMRINPNGNVGIGTESPGEKLEVAGTVHSTSGGFRFPDGSLQTTAAGGGGGDNWSVLDSVLYTKDYWGIARGGAGSVCSGDSAHTGVNLGVACTTDSYYSSIGGGRGNKAISHYTTVGGGLYNQVSDSYSTIGGGFFNIITANNASIGGGSFNVIHGSPDYGTYSVIAGGSENDIYGPRSVIGGGHSNRVSGSFSGILGGESNRVDGSRSAILGGSADTITSTADYSYLFGIGSKLTEDSTFMVDMPHIHFGDETDGYEFPASDGTADQVMVTDGSGLLSWTSAAGGWVDYGEVVELATSTDRVGIGASPSTAKLKVVATSQYAGYFTSDSATENTHVVHGEYVGDETSGHPVAVYGKCDPVHPTSGSQGYGGEFEGGKFGVKAKVTPTPGDEPNAYYAAGHFNCTGGGNLNEGVDAYASGSGQTEGIRAVAVSTGTNEYYDPYCAGVRAEAHCDYGWAGLFTADVWVWGVLTEGKGGFMIDHPLDPENKYLSHSFVESPDMMNVYNGNAQLDKNGEAVIQLPDYFEAVNRDFRYQLTCVGGFAPVYVAQEVSNNQFSIAGGNPGMKVSWQVTGVRKDPFAEDNRIQVEVDKPPMEQGRYLHPESYGLSDDLSVRYGKREPSEAGR